MWPFKKAMPTKDLKEVFLDEAAYAAHIDSLAVEASARVARGGIALQMGDVITKGEFDREMETLTREVQKGPAA